MAKSVILLYDPIPSLWSSKLKQLCALQGYRLRLVEPREVGCSLRALATDKTEAPRPAREIPEPMFVFCGFTSSQLDRLLAGLRRIGVPITCLKAVLTPTNSGWTFSALYGELCRERLAMGSFRQ